MNISITTDFSGHTMAPEPQLRQIAECCERIGKMYEIIKQTRS